jgi:hypothetical protein
MRTRFWLSAALALVLVACGAPPQLTPQTAGPLMGGGGGARSLTPGVSSDGEIYPTSNHYRVMEAQELPLVGVSVDSQIDSLPAGRIIDGDRSTQWSNGGYLNPTAWAAVQLSAPASLASIDIKTGPSATRTYYDVQVSQNGTTWSTVLSNQINTTWQMETKTLPAGTTGQKVRIFWHNSSTNPIPHFSIFELVVNGTPSVAPSPTPSNSPTPLPSPSPSSTPTPSPMPSSPPGSVRQLAPISVNATSTYNGLTPDRAVDGDLSTQWASGNYQSRSESLTLQFDQVYTFDHMAIKTGYLPNGVVYNAQTSNDGINWTLVGGEFTNATWEMETKLLSGQGKFLRIAFLNDTAIARVSIFEVSIYGKTSATLTSKTLEVNGQNNTVTFKHAASIGGPLGNIINVETNAYNNTLQRLKFPAMLGADRTRYGYDYARITADNAKSWESDLGSPGLVSFLDDVNGLTDNSGDWTFTHENNNEIFPVIANATHNVTTWDPAKVAFLDLGSTTRTWNLTAAYDSNTFNAFTPGVVLVYTRPEGVRDFTFALSGYFPGQGGATTFQTQGTVYAFFLATEPSPSQFNATLTLTSFN